VQIGGEWGVLKTEKLGHAAFCKDGLGGQSLSGSARDQQGDTDSKAPREAHG